jgi:hypothetical protein
MNNKIEAAWHELISLEKEELLKKWEDLDLKINDSSPLQLAIENLNTKIEESRTWIERTILEKQIKELEKLNKLYQEYLKKNLNISTKNQLNQLFTSITWQVNLKENRIWDETIKISNIIQEHDDLFEDTIDFIWDNTIRDTVENFIDIKWELESLPIQSYQEFFNIVAVSYIEYLEVYKGSKLTTKELDSIIQLSWFYIHGENLSNIQNELDYFQYILLGKLEKRKINLDFNFILKIRNTKFKWEQEINLSDYKKNLNLNSNNQEKNNTTIELPTKKEKISEKDSNEKEQLSMETLNHIWTITKWLYFWKICKNAWIKYTWKNISIKWINGKNANINILPVNTDIYYNKDKNWKTLIFLNERKKWTNPESFYKPWKENFLQIVEQVASNFPKIPKQKLTTLINHENWKWNPYVKAAKTSAYWLWQMIDRTWDNIWKWLDRQNPTDQLVATCRLLNEIMKNTNCSIELALAYYNTWQGINKISNTKAINYAKRNPAIRKLIPYKINEINRKRYFIWAVAYYNDISYKNAEKLI